MVKISKLEDAYRFPGFRALSKLSGVFGDSFARVITLIRRQKKRHAAPVVGYIRVFTTGKLDGYETFPVVGFASIWTWRFAVSFAKAAAS
jgi:hypothetical protein